jgi:hypothetical protein
MDPVVAVALGHIERRVDLPDGRGDPENKRAAVEAFRILARHGHTWDADEVERWAIDHAWPGVAATGLRDFAASVESDYLFRLPGGEPMWIAAVINAWREEAKSQLAS